MTAARLKKLLGPVDFPHISSIALFKVFFWLVLGMTTKVLSQKYASLPVKSQLKKLVGQRDRDTGRNWLHLRKILTFFAKITTRLFVI